VARYTFPQDRSAFIYGNDYSPILTPPRTAIQVFTDHALTDLADILTPDGDPIALSTLYTVRGLIPEFLGPEGHVRLWAGPSEAEAYPLDAQATSLLGDVAVGGGVSALRTTGTAAGALSGHRVVTP
jgi:hypothetical protein